MTGHDDGSLLQQFSNFVLVYDSPLLDLTRYVIAAVSGMTAALLLRLYASHRTGRMNAMAGFGAVSTYAVIAWAQVVAIGGPNNDLTLLNVGVLVAVVVSFAGTLKAMDSSLFRRPG